MLEKPLVLLSEGLRFFRRRIKIFFNKNRFLMSYSGNHLQICDQIINDCWNKKEKFFMTSKGHFCQFYVRDFAYNIESLIHLGYKKQCIQTLDYALNKFKKASHIMTTISPNGDPYNFPKFTPESLALIIYCVALVSDKTLLHKYKTFLEKELKYVISRSISKTGLITTKEYYSSCRDHIKRRSACYDNVMLGLLSASLDKLKLKNPLKKFNYEELLIEYFWKKEYFIDDLSGLNDITGDANSAPFRFLLTSKKFDTLFAKSINVIQKLKLDKPFPIKYSTIKTAKTNIADLFAKDYESDSVWPHVAYNYIFAVSRFDQKLAKKYLLQYKHQIEKYKTFPEVYDKTGKLFHSPFYFCDEAMLWAANHIYLCKKLGIE
jgi:hypothetical protein